LKKSAWALLLFLLLTAVFSATGSSILGATFGLLAILVALILILSRIGGVLAGPLFKTARPKAYGGATRTQRGEVVRSNSERKIADYFYQSNIHYLYEEEATSKRGRRRISRPDFYLPDYGVYVEYWGLIDADDSRLRSRYERTMKWKMAQYHTNDIKFISIYPRNLDNLDWVFRAKFKGVAGFDLPAEANGRRRKYCANCGRPVEAGWRFCRNCGNGIAG
jgi:hypothetical protein